MCERYTSIYTSELDLCGVCKRVGEKKHIIHFYLLNFYINSHTKKYVI